MMIIISEIGRSDTLVHQHDRGLMWSIEICWLDYWCRSIIVKNWEDSARESFFSHTTDIASSNKTREWQLANSALTLYNGCHALSCQRWQPSNCLSLCLFVVIWNEVMEKKGVEKKRESLSLFLFYIDRSRVKIGFFFSQFSSENYWTLVHPFSKLSLSWQKVQKQLLWV